MSYPVESVITNHKIKTVISLMHDSKHNGFPVVNTHDELVGIVTLQDIRELPVPGIMDLPVTSAMSKQLIVCNPENTLQDVFIKLNKCDIGHLPVVEQDNPKKLVGIITRSDVIKAYDQRILNPAMNH
jgi:CIC family chloride channel protein